MAAETAAERNARDFGYKLLTGDANHEAGTVRYDRNVKHQTDERLARQYATVNASTNVATGLEGKTVDLDTVAVVTS